MTPERWRRIEELFHAAQESGAGVLAGVPSDLRREVESLLAQASGENLLDRPLSEFLESAPEIPMSAGSRLGPYRIEKLLGAGGMGRVYRGIDTRLDREVAIKVVAQHFSARFEREARSISSLNHPHICTLYDVGPNYLVLELISGSNLADRLKSGALPLEQAIRYGIEIADALAAAHARGIVHRDLKPANIMVPKSGIKVLDFGLAQSKEHETLTAPEMVIGTPAYMAPEQRQGSAVTPRTDIYALGLVLHEMALGKRPAEQVPLSTHTLPPGFAHIIERCLAVDPNERWQAASDVKAELEWIATVARSERTASSKPHFAWIFAGLSAIAAAAMAFWMYSKPPLAERPAQIPFYLSEAGDQMPMVSPNGRYLAFAGQDQNGNRRLFTRAFAESTVHALAGTDNASEPMWSPDNQWIAFFAAGQLKKVRPQGGPVQAIAELPGFQGGSWGLNGDIIFRPSNRAALFLLRAAGGTPVQVTHLDVSLGENSHRGVQFLPDGRRFLYLARSAKRENNALYLGSIDSSARKRVTQMDANAYYLSPLHREMGRLLYYKDGALLVQPFDTDGARLAGEPRIVAEGIAFYTASTLANFSASSDGRWLLVRRSSATYTHFQWVDRRGQVEETLPIEGELSQPRLAPTGERLAFSRPNRHGGNRELCVAELARRIVAPLTSNPGNNWFGVWSPNGEQILFDSDRDSSPKFTTYLKKSMEPGSGEIPTTLPEDPHDWSADGNWIALGSDKILIASAKDFHTFTYLATGFREAGPRFSPDTKWLAYSSNESGEFEIYIRPFTGQPAGPGQIQISTNGGDFPVWPKGGHEIFFMSTDNFIYSVNLSNLGSTRTVPPPVKLFRACPQTIPSQRSGSNFTYANTFDTNDGNRFLLNCRVSPPGQFLLLLDSTLRAPEADRQ